MKKTIVLFVLAFFAQLALAGNTPCSGKKGGVAHCSGETFVCKDGSTSKSKRKCPVGVHGSGKKVEQGKPPVKTGK